MTSTATTARWEEVSAPFGIASLRHTHWLDGTPREFEGVPGQWWADGGAVHGRDLPELGTVSLAPQAQAREGRLRLRAIERDGALALRVFDPETPGRVNLTGIESYDSDDLWVFPARFIAADGGEVTVHSVDGHERTVPATGSVQFDLAGTPIALTVSRDGDGLFAVIADETAADGAYRFRFLSLPAPAADGAVDIDFSTAYLPPCAFSDQYVCPLPPAENRLPIAVTAGEKRALRA